MNRKLISAVLLAAFPVGSAPATEKPAEFPALEAVEREVARLVETARPSVVGVIARSRLAPLLDTLGGKVKIEGDTGDGGPMARRIGSGIVIDADGHIATLASLVSGATEVMVVPSRGERIRARVLGTDDYSGLAVLDLGEAGRSSRLRAVVFTDSDALKVGSLVTAFSSPSGNPDSAPVYSFGFVSGMGVSEGPARRCSYIKFNAYAPPGAGGGPVLDSQGRLVGILFGAGGGDRRSGGELIHWDHPAPADADSPEQLWILRSLKRPGSEEGGVAYAVPGNIVRRASEQIIRTGSVRRGWVGVKIEESEPGDVRLLAVVPGGPASKTGLQPGDRIVAFNDNPLPTSAVLVDGIASSAPGTVVRLAIERDGRKKDVALTLGEAPPQRAPRARQWPVPMPRVPAPALGIEVDIDTDDDLRTRLGAPEGVGLLVEKVHVESRAKRAGMATGDLLVEAMGEPIRSLTDLRRALRRQGQRDMRVEVVRKGRRVVLNVPPPPPPPPPPQAPSP